MKHTAVNTAAGTSENSAQIPAAEPEQRRAPNSVSMRSDARAAENSTKSKSALLYDDSFNLGFITSSVSVSPDSITAPASTDALSAVDFVISVTPSDTRDSTAPHTAPKAADFTVFPRFPTADFQTAELSPNAITSTAVKSNSSPHISMNTGDITPTPKQTDAVMSTTLAACDTVR